MNHPILSDDDAMTLFATLRDTTFDWTAAQLPSLMEKLGWTIDTATAIPGKAAIADVAWDLPDVDVDVQFDGNAVSAFYIPLASPADDPESQLKLVDAFVRFSTLLQDIFGAPGVRTAGEYPALRWQNEKYTLTLQNATEMIMIAWVSAEHQRTLDILEES